MSGPLDNARWERFAQLLASGIPATHAYEQAGFAARGNAAAVQAGKLRRKPIVAARVAELQATSEEATLRTRDESLRDLESIAFDEDAKASDRVKAHALIAKMRGWERQAEPSDKPVNVALCISLEDARRGAAGEDDDEERGT